MTFEIRSTPPIDVRIDDVPVQFFGDPPDTALLELFKMQDQFGTTAESQLAAIGLLRGCLAGLVVPDSLEAWAGLVAAGKITLGVTMQLFEHLTDNYGDALGFRGGQRQKSPGGLPENAGTSEVSSPEPAAV